MCIVTITFITKNVDYILQLALFRQLPSRMLSRTWGEITSKELPKWCRRPVLGLYVWAFGCDMEEALIEDIREYPSLSKLFTRQLKEGARVVDSECLVVSSSYLCWHVVFIIIAVLCVHLSDDIHLLTIIYQDGPVFMVSRSSLILQFFYSIFVLACIKNIVEPEVIDKA